MRQALSASGAAFITMALKRIELENPQDDFLAAIAELPVQFLPNTAGARTAEEAVKIAKLARAAVNHAWVKLEVTPNPKHLLPDPVETFKAAVILVKAGFTVFPYINADPILAKRLAEIGCATVMPLGAPIGSNRGLKTLDQLQLIIAEATVPVIIDAGIGAPSHAALAMECGADGVLVNTAIATAKHPVQMAKAFNLAVTAGRSAYLAQLAAVRPPTGAAAQAAPTSPLPKFLH